MTSVDWRTELRKIEREFDGLAPEPSPAELRARRAEELREQERQDERAARVGAWARLVSIAALASGLAFWPYPRTCGFDLYAYMGAATGVVVGGLWVAECTWRSRMAKTHGLAILVLIAGLSRAQTGAAAQECLCDVPFSGGAVGLDSRRVRGSLTTRHDRDRRRPLRNRPTARAGCVRPFLSRARHATSP